MNATQVIQELNDAFNGITNLAERNQPFSCLLAYRIAQGGKPVLEMTVAEARHTINSVTDEYDDATEAERTIWPRICLEAKDALELGVAA